MKMPFGKHKGKDLLQVPADYLRWVLQKTDPEPWLREAIYDAFHDRQRRQRALRRRQLREEALD